MQNFNSATNEYFFKVVLIGAPSVGKTSILERFVTDLYTEDYKATIGADFRTKDIIINGQTVLLQIWDTAGQERFRALAAPFYRGANICVLVFDVNDKLSFEAIEQWRDEFLHHADVENQDSFPFLLLGNKSDLGGKVSKADVNRFLQQRGYKNMVYLETSALTNTNITEAFDQVAKLCLRNCEKDNVYVPQETSQQIQEEYARLDDATSQASENRLHLEDVMSQPDHELQNSGICGAYCSLL